MNMTIERIRQDTDLNGQNLHVFSVILDQYESMEEVDIAFYTEIERICALTDRQDKRGVELIARIDKIILRDYSSPSLCLDSIANEIGLSANYISRIYRGKTGNSILNYITLVRMQEARKLLAQTDIPIQDISTRCGFTTLSYFYRIFKKENGMPPAEYRIKKS